MKRAYLNILRARIKQFESSATRNADTLAFSPTVDECDGKFFKKKKRESKR